MAAGFSLANGPAPGGESVLDSNEYWFTHGRPDRLLAASTPAVCSLPARLKAPCPGAGAVIDDLVKNPVSIGQLLLEFHHMLPGIAVKKTERAIDQLAALGFVPFAVSKTGREWSFAKR